MQYSIGRTAQQNISVGGIYFNQKEMQAAYLNGKQIYPNEKQIVGLFSVAPDDTETDEKQQLFQLVLCKPLRYNKGSTYDGVTEYLYLTHRGKKYNLLCSGEGNSIPPDATNRAQKEHVYKSFSTEDFGYVEEGDEIEVDYCIFPFSYWDLFPGGSDIFHQQSGTLEIAAPIITSKLSYEFQSLNSNLQPVGSNTINIVSYPDKTTIYNRSANIDGGNLVVNRVAGSRGFIAKFTLQTGVAWQTTHAAIFHGHKRADNTVIGSDAMIGKIKGKVIPYTTITPSQL